MRIFVIGMPHIEVDIVRYFAAGIIVPIRPSTQEIKKISGEEVGNGNHV